MTRIELPYPKNELNPNRRGWGKGAMYRHAALVKSAKQHAHYSAIEAGWAGTLAFKGYDTILRPEIIITFCPPDKRRRDLDNAIASFKASQDGIADALGIDDSKWAVSYRWGEPVKGGRVIVELAA